MPDYLLWGKAILAAAITAALLELIVAWAWRSPAGSRFGWLLGLAAGFYAGCAVFNVWPHGSLLEARVRLLAVLMPLTFVVEIVAAFARTPRWLAWLLRMGVVAAAAPILLYQSVYLADLAGPHSAEWSPTEAALILTLLAFLLAAVWILLALLQTRTSRQTAASILMVSSLAAALTVMLSGYLGGGLLGLALAGALAGQMLASFAVPSSVSHSYSLGVGLIGLFGVLLIGRFFGSLPTSAALGLWFAPLLAWLPEVPGLRRLGPRLRVALRLALVAAPLIIVVVDAEKRFEEKSTAHASPYDL